MSMLAPPRVEPPPPAAPLSPQEQQARTWNMWCHLSALSGLVGVPFGSVLGPLLVWQLKKDEIPSVIAHGKAAMNFQLTVLLATIVVAIPVVILCFFCVGFILLPFLALIPLAGIIFSVIAGVKANDGKEYQYPWSLNLIS